MIMKNRDTEKNLITNIVAMLVTSLLNFVLTPVITEKLGLEVYSYVGIITNIISFFTVITYTLNSMVGRFYTISLKSDQQESNEYISTALYTCFIIGSCLIPIMIIATVFLDKLIVINPQYITDVKIAFLCSCIVFIFGIISSVFTTGAYAKNKLYITNTYNIVMGVLKTIFLYTVFKLFIPRIWYIALGNIVQQVVVLLLALFFFKKLIPGVAFSAKLFRKKKAYELLSAGAFNSLIMMGNTLMTQIDLLVGNRYIDGEIVGAYSVVLIFSTTMRSIGSALSNAFSPTTLHVYAEKGIAGLKDYSNKVVSFLAVLIGWPAMGIACLGCAFVNIWLKRDLSDLYYVFVILMLPMGANLACTQLYVVQQAVNKLKIPAVASIIAGLFNLILAVFLVKYTDFGVVGIAIASTISFSLRNLIFQPVYTSYITGQPWYVFFKGLCRPIVAQLFVYILWSIARQIIGINSFLKFVIAALLLSIVYFVVNFLTLSREERCFIISKGRGLIGGKKKRGN